MLTRFLRIIGIGRWIQDSKNPYNVKVGQTWQDWDGRFRKDTPVFKKILKIQGRYAYCEGIRRGKMISQTRILLSRFKPSSTGYRLIGKK